MKKEGRFSEELEREKMWNERKKNVSVGNGRNYNVRKQEMKEERNIRERRKAKKEGRLQTREAEREEKVGRTEKVLCWKRTWKETKL